MWSGLVTLGLPFHPGAAFRFEVPLAVSPSLEEQIVLSLKVSWLSIQSASLTSSVERVFLKVDKLAGSKVRRFKHCPCRCRVATPEGNQTYEKTKESVSVRTRHF